MTPALRLTQIDPDRNRARFYALSLQPTLFGDVALMRQWGRIGTAGQGQMQTCADEAAAREALARMLRQKLRRGYCPA